MLYATPFRGWLFILKISSLQEIEAPHCLFFGECSLCITFSNKDCLSVVCVLQFSLKIAINPVFTIVQFLSEIMPETWKKLLVKGQTAKVVAIIRFRSYSYV
jgi:hypothetical protein